MAPKITIAMVLGCGLLGGYASMFSSYRYGYFDALRACVTKSSETCVLDTSASVVKHITGVPRVDDPINVLLEFFSQGLRPDPNAKGGFDLEALLGFVYLATQFAGAWFLIALEGLRVGHKGKLLSRTGAFGMVFQAITITIVSPIYLALQLLGSPSSIEPKTLLVDPRDLALLPLSSTVTYLIPTILMTLALLNVISGNERWLAIALWQPFPLYHSAIQGLSKLFRGSGHGTADDGGSIDLQEFRKTLKRANRLITLLMVVVHWVVMGVILASSYTDLVPQVSGHHILALTSLENPPLTAMRSPPISITESREMVVSFLRWDMYCTCAAVLIWSIYHLQAMRGSPGFVVILIKALFYGLIGGPTFPSLMLVWERDEIALGILEVLNRGQKPRRRTKA